MNTKTHEVRLDANHLYWVDGVRRPGYSEILDNMGFPKNPFWNDAGRDQGTALSQWLLFLAQGNEATENPDPRIAGRVAGIQKFFKEHEFVFVGGETPLYNEERGHCVTPDIYGYLDGVSSVIEAKRGARMERHKLQTAAQTSTLEENGFMPVNQLSLYLNDCGYSLEAHEDNEDFECWFAILSGYMAKERYK